MPLFPSTKEMNINSNDTTRRRSDLSNKLSSRYSSISLSSFSILYHECMKIDNNRSDHEDRKPVNCSQLSYEDRTNSGISVSGMADNSSTCYNSKILE